MVVLQTSDGVGVIVDRDLIRLSERLDQIMTAREGDPNITEAGMDAPIPLDRVNNKALASVIEWLQVSYGC